MPVPRIRDAYLDCAIYLYASEKDAEEGKRTGGSGFLVGTPATGLPGDRWIVYAVTNKHVVSDGNSVIRLKTKTGEHFPMAIDERAWIVHPDGDDLAVVAIASDWKSLRYNIVPRSSFLDREICAQFNIGVGDEAFVVGRFINHEGRQQNLPTARFGCIAQMPIEPVIQPGAAKFKQESFLVEARSIGGYSGSPVFVYISALSLRDGVQDWAPQVNDLRVIGSKDWGMLKTHGPWLLGIDWGHLNDWQPVCDAQGDPVDRSTLKPPWNPQVLVNTGIMTVVPAWKLIDMIDRGPIAEQRKEIIEKLRREEETNPPAASFD